MAVLRSDGFQTIEAENGVQALELMRKLDTTVDLLVSDIQMPKMDGITLACSVRAEFPPVPVILISGYATSNKRSSRSYLRVCPKAVPSGHASECCGESDEAEGHAIVGWEIPISADHFGQMGAEIPSSAWAGFRANAAVVRRSASSRCLKRTMFLLSLFCGMTS